MLGELVYFCDMTERKVKQGYVLTRTISDSGYIVNIVMSNGIKKNVENALIFDKLENAEENLIKFILFFLTRSGSAFARTRRRIIFTFFYFTFIYFYLGMHLLCICISFAMQLHCICIAFAFNLLCICIRLCCFSPSVSPSLKKL